MTLKTLIPAVALLFTANQSMAQDTQETAPVATDTLEATCTCAKEKLVSVKMLYQKDNKLSMFRHTISTGGVTVYEDAIVKKLTGIRPRKGTEKQKFKTSNNNLSDELSEILDLAVKNGEKTCKTEFETKANSEKIVLINAGKYPITLPEEDKNKTITWFEALRL